MIERWRDIKGYEGYYQVSDLGRVRSLDRVIETRNQYGVFSNRLKGRIHIPQPTRLGYLSVGLSRDGKHKSFLIHRLVSLEFVKNTNSRKEVNHIDGDKSNNQARNLEWVSRGENLEHAYAIGLRSAKRGSDVTGSKLTESDVREIRESCEMPSHLSRIYGVSLSHITRIIKRETWRHL